MLRVSSLGLQLPTIIIPVFRKCLPAPRVNNGRGSLTFGRSSSAGRLLVRPRRTSTVDLDTESSRPGGVAHPVVFSSSIAEKRRCPKSEMGDVPGQGELDDDDTVLETDIQNSAINIDLLTQDGEDSNVVELTERDKETECISPLETLVQDNHTMSSPRRPVKPLYTDSNNGNCGLPQRPTIPLVKNMLEVLATTSSAQDGWKAYQALSQLQQQHDATGGGQGAVSIIPFSHLHRLARVIAQKTPRTRARFLHLLAVLTTIHDYGGKVQLHEWNALIDYAGKGWRKTRSEDFNNALSIYHDMIYNRPPGSRFSEDGFDDMLLPHPSDKPFDEPLPTPAIQPDVYTYTTLINIAARTGHPRIIQRATMLLEQAKLPPNRITHLSLLKYFTAKNHLSGVRSTLVKMREQNLEVGIDGLNACMWAYGHNHRVDVLMMIYRLLRHNMVPEQFDGHDDDISSVQERLRVEEGIVVAPELRPNEITFTLMIQIMSYHGNLSGTLNVFLDMLSTPNNDQSAIANSDKSDDFPVAPYSPTIHVFRAIFLGFSRHVVKPHAPIAFPTFAFSDLDNPEWNLENLYVIFEKFLDLPQQTKIPESTVFWILNSFSKASGHDVELMRTVWVRMEKRFGRFRGGPNHRVTKWRLKLFPKAKKAEDNE